MNLTAHLYSTFQRSFSIIKINIQVTFTFNFENETLLSRKIYTHLLSVMSKPQLGITIKFGVQYNVYTKLFTEFNSHTQLTLNIDDQHLT